MTKLTEDELLCGYDQSQPVAPPPQRAESDPAPVAIATCSEGHPLPNGGRCRECKRLRDLNARYSKAKCDRGHLWTAENTTYKTLNGANGTTRKVRQCVACHSEREQRRLDRLATRKVDQRIPGFSARDSRKGARKRVDTIDLYILNVDTDGMTTHQLVEWRATRDRLVAEKDLLVKRFHFA